MLSRILFVCILAVIHPCHALSSSPQPSPLEGSPAYSSTQQRSTIVISQKSNGQRTVFSFADPNKRPSCKLQRNQYKIRHSIIASLHRIQSALQSTFFPTVHADFNRNGQINNPMSSLSRLGYLAYILHDNIQDLSTTLRSVLVKQRILEGIGVGRPGPTALSATLNFLIKDGCGIISSLVFTSCASIGFRRDVKRWKFFSAIMLDIGLTLQIVASSSGGLFLPLLCLGSICEAMYNVASSPCTGVIKLHWAVVLLGTEDGIAEISAKRRAQLFCQGLG